MRRELPRLSPLRVGRVLVRGRSMHPTLREGDHLLVLWGGRARTGRLVVVRWPGRPLSVKRAVHRDGAGWWVERDNPADGVDSWSAGPVAERDVVATVLLRLWPPRPIRRRRGARPPTAGPRSGGG